MKAEITNVYTDFDALMQQVNASLFRLYAVRSTDGLNTPLGFVVVYADLNQATGFSLRVTMCRAIGQTIELVSQAPLPLLSLYVDIKRQVEDWDGTLATYPLAPIAEDDASDYYGELETPEDELT